MSPPPSHWGFQSYNASTGWNWCGYMTVYTRRFLYIPWLPKCPFTIHTGKTSPRLSIYIASLILKSWSWEVLGEGSLEGGNCCKTAFTCMRASLLEVHIVLKHSGEQNKWGNKVNGTLQLNWTIKIKLQTLTLFLKKNAQFCFGLIEVWGPLFSFSNQTDFQKVICSTSVQFFFKY